MSFNIVFFGVFLTIVVCAFIFFGINPVKYIDMFYQRSLTKIANSNIKRSVKNIKKQRIIKDQNKLMSAYSGIISRIILDYNLPVTVEGLNSFVILIFFLLSIFVFVFLQNLMMAFLISISLIIAAFTYFIMQARIAEAKKIEAVMDAEDLICPMAKEGVLVAIKKVLENKDYLSPSIRPFFVQFVDNCESLGFSFNKAMQILNRQLGPKFDNFAKKAVVFESNERKGMADIFLDIVDENAALREINARKNIAFRKMNREFILKTLMIAVFVLYSLMGEGYRDFMIGTDVGKIVNSVAIIAVCLSFARCQMLQREVS